ncbi:hypothetical protein CYMTET_9944 [Cymbomonas tetramitiformis]|uniref:Uncharacterized protein n=1 Tax=Cymbomonas tetramitiformis TaxID=36881 RepID=A0AAE0LEZ5_9CHLO|nr:hypothetical protein CYMTET_9944 [Cymbomonas tetramitiformis]
MSSELEPLPVCFESFLEEAIDRDEAFFELANAKAVRFSVGGKHIDVTQDTALHDCCGGIIWETSFCLSRYLQKHLRKQVSRQLADFKVVELGAGCGLLGLVLSTMKCSVVLTDAPPALPLLRRNVAENADKLTFPAKVLPLDWESSSDLNAVKEHGPFDLLVATDVVFAERSPEAFKAFMTSVAEQFKVVRIPNSERTAEVAIAEDLPHSASTQETEEEEDELHRYR